MVVWYGGIVCVDGNDEWGFGFRVEIALKFETQPILNHDHHPLSLSLSLMDDQKSSEAEETYQSQGCAFGVNI